MLRPSSLNLNTVVGEMAKMLRRILGEHINLDTVLDTSLCAVRADQSQIEQVILNLVINARDAMPKGGEITIETANVSLDEHYAQRRTGVEPGQYVLMAVSDTGAGMTRKRRRKSLNHSLLRKR